MVTKDLGHIKNGYLYFDGRADDQINCGGKKVFSHTIESKMLSNLGLENGIAVTGVQHPVRGESILIAYSRKAVRDSKKLESAFTKTMKELNVLSSRNGIFFPCKHFPRTKTGKLKRRELRRIYSNAISEMI